MDFVTTYLIMTTALCGAVYAGPLPSPGGNCTNFFAITEQSLQCVGSYPKPKSSPDGISTSDPLAKVKFMCMHRQEEQRCMNDAFEHCKSQDKIITLLGETYSYCNGNNAADWITNYAETSSGTVTTECFNSIQKSSGICAHRVMNGTNPSMFEAFEDKTNFFREFTSIAFNCIISGGEQAISNTPECSGAYWKDAIFNFVVLMTTIPGFSLWYRLLEEDTVLLQNTVS